MKHFLTILVLLLLPCLTGLADQQPLPPDQAFALSTSLGDDNSVMLQWNIAPRHYLYQQRFHFTILKPRRASIGTIIFPTPEMRQDTLLGTYPVYTKQLSLAVPIIDAGKKEVILQVNYQGCSAAGYCYPPVTHKISVNFIQKKIRIDKQTFTESFQQSEHIQSLASKHIILVFFSFVGFGLLLAFTPCVLPMIPILSGLILGHTHLSTGKAFRLSLTYVLSMSFTYAIAGMLVGYLGGSLQALMQMPWVISAFSVVFVLMALSMFGLYNIQPPEKLERYLATISGHQKKGSYIGVAIMGCLGTLILSPCVTPALVTALGYITQRGNVLLGGLTLFATGLGMGLPLLLIGPAHKALPKAGHWMVRIKFILGFMLLAMTILLLARILPATMTLLLWGIWLASIGCYLLTTAHWHKYVVRGLGTAVLFYSFVLIIAAGTGHTDPFRPFSKPVHLTLSFQPIQNMGDLTRTLALAQLQHKPVLIDFYADWCIACKQMESTTFIDPQIQAEMRKFLLLRVDITNNSAADKMLMQKYQVIAPPTLLFLNAKGEELRHLRVIGEKSAAELLSVLKEASMPATPE